MNTTRTPRRPLAAAGAFHESTRTAVSINLDPATGERRHTLVNSRLSMAWQGGELRIACSAQNVALAMPRSGRAQ